MLVTGYPPRVDGMTISPVVDELIAGENQSPVPTDASPPPTRYVHAIPSTVSVSASALSDNITAAERTSLFIALDIAFIFRPFFSAAFADLMRGLKLLICSRASAPPSRHMALHARQRVLYHIWRALKLSTRLRGRAPGWRRPPRRKAHRATCGPRWRAQPRTCRKGRQGGSSAARGSGPWPGGACRSTAPIS